MIAARVFRPVLLVAVGAAAWLLVSWLTPRQTSGLANVGFDFPLMSDAEIEDDLLALQRSLDNGETSR